MTTQSETGFPSLASGLHRRLLAFVVLPLVLISAVGIHLGLNRVSSIQEERMKADLDLVGRAIRIPIANALADNDQERMQLALQSLFSIGRIYGASIFDVNGVRLASAGITEQDLTDSSIPLTIVATGETQEGYREVAGREMFSHFLPIFDAGGQTAGLIQLNRLASDFETALDRLSLLAWLLWFGFSLVIILIVLLGHYSGVGRHVDRLLSHMQRIERGEHNYRVPVNGPVEVKAIAGGVNRMLDSMEKSQQRILEHQLREQQLSSRLRDSEKMAAIGHMARGVAHELGAPLNVIDGRTQRLARYLPDHPGAEQEVQGIRAQVARLTRAVYQLLDYSRTETPDIVSVQIQPLVHKTLEALQPESHEAGIQLSADLPETPAFVQGDSRRLELALLNLGRNAVQAAKTRARLVVELKDQQVIYAAEDDGPGLDDHAMSRLIQPFYTTKPAGEGTGLGLAITHNIIQEHGGELQIQNRPEGGCRATIRLSRMPNQLVGNQKSA